MFEHMEIAESIYEGVVETSYKKTTGAYSNYAGNRRLKRVETVSSKNPSNMSESAGKCRKIYVDNPKDRYKPICLIQGLRHSLDECTVLLDFGSKCANNRPTKDCRNDTTNRRKFNRQQ